MIKHVNFTGRRRITHDRVNIEVYDGHPRSFDAAIDLAGLPLLPAAAVVLEATCAGSNVIKRYEFGEVANLRPPSAKERLLSELEGENVFFTLKIVDRTEQTGRIIGLAEHIRPQRAGKQTAAGRKGILPIDKKDLGQEIWQLDFGTHDVTLFVNEQIPGLVDRARSDALFYSTVYPEVVRHILTQAIVRGGDPDDENDDWPTLWLRFGKNLNPSDPVPTNRDEPDDREDWIEEVVAAFCNAHQLKDKYLAALAAVNGGEG